jgi:hypothetical protein
MYLAKAMALSDSSECKISRFTKHKSEEEQKNILNKYDDCLDQQLSLFDKSIRYSYAYLFSTKRQPMIVFLIIDKFKFAISIIKPLPKWSVFMI